MVSSAREVAETIARYDHLRWSTAVFKWTYGREMRLAPHFRIMAQVIDDVMAGKRKRVIFNLPPRFGKTETAVISLFSKIYAINPAARNMHLSYSDDLVRKNSRKILTACRSANFKMLFPGLVISQDSSAQNHWETTAGGEFHAVTTQSGVTGFEVGQEGNPFDGVMVIDDAIKSSDARSAAKRKAAKEVVADAIITRLNHVNTPVIYIGQRVHGEDPPSFLMNGGTGDRWDVVCFQALSETGRPPEHYQDFSHADLVDYQIKPGALWPWRKSKEDLLKIKDAAESDDESDPKGARTFAAEYQQDPTDSSIALFDESWLEYYKEIEIPWSLSNLTIRIDTAQKGQAGSDHHALSVFGHDKRDKSIVYLIYCDRKRCPFPDLVDWVIEHVAWVKQFETRSLRLSKITIEDANVGTALQQSLRVKFKEKSVRVGINLTPKYGNKFDRAFESEAFFQQKRFHVPSEPTRFMPDQKMTQISQLVSEFKTFTETDTHASDDILDTVCWEMVSRYGKAPNKETFVYAV